MTNNSRECTLRCVNNFYKRTKYNNDFGYSFELYSWPQTWGNTSCGFGGIGGKAMTTRQTVVIHDNYTDHWFVYHGRFAYTITRNHDAIKRFLDRKQFPGQCEAEKIFGEENVNKQ